MNKHAFQRPKSVQEVQNPNADPAQYPEVAAVKTPLYKPFIIRIQPINMKMWWQVSSRPHPLRQKNSESRSARRDAANLPNADAVKEH